MRLLAALSGLCLIFLVVRDLLLWTTFLEGGGPLTTPVCGFLARRVLALHRRGKHGGKGRCIIARAGLITVCATLLMWGVILWLGWGLIFNGSATAVVGARGGGPADAWTRFYFAATTLATVGLGDYQPQGAFWQALTAVAGASGFLLFTLALSYIVPVVAAATQKRQVALCIWSLGRNPTDIIVRAWNGADTTALGPHLVALTSMLALLGESHVTYPVLHYFHSTKRSSAAAPCVAALDEALTILECGLQRGCSLDLPALGAARESITEFLNTLAPALIQPGTSNVPPPSLQGLREMGIPVVDDEIFNSALEGLGGRRRLLLALVHNEGWDWETVWPPVGTTPSTNAAAIAAS